MILSQPLGAHEICDYDILQNLNTCDTRSRAKCSYIEELVSDAVLAGNSRCHSGQQSPLCCKLDLARSFLTRSPMELTLVSFEVCVGVSPCGLASFVAPPAPHSSQPTLDSSIQFPSDDVRV